MERPLKERLVGAGVLVLVVVLVLPELLSGRRDSASPSATRDDEGVPLRAHEFVMGDAPTPEEQAVEADTLQPDPTGGEVAGTLPADETVPEAPAVAAAVPPAAAPVAAPPAATQSPTQSPKQAATQAATQAAPPPSAPAPATPKPAPAVPKSPPPTVPKSVPEAAPPAATPSHLGAWVVQIGSFGTAQKAEQLVRDLRSRGFRAFTLPYTANGRTLHRVRVGPEQNRKVADDIARRLEALGYTPHVAPQE